MRVTVLFKLNGEVVVEEPNDMEIHSIIRMKNLIVQECECDYNDIEVEVKRDMELSKEIDVCKDGLVFYDNLCLGIITGISCCLEDGSNKFLDAITSDIFDKYVTFITKD